MPEQTVSTTSSKVYEAPPKQTHSLSLTLAWVLLIIVLLLVVALYIIYFVYATSNGQYGVPMKSVLVPDTSITINPVGNSVYFVNGGSTTRGGNDYLYLAIPNQIPYINRTFVIFNTSSSNQLELRASEGIVTLLNGQSVGSFFIQPLTSVVFFWYSKNQLLPLLVGGNPLQNS